MANIPPLPSSPSGARKRKCDPDNWQRNIAKKARNEGLEYVSKYRGTTVAARRVGAPCQCSQKCFTLLGDEAITAIHKDFWSTGDHNLQTGFIQSCAIENAVKRHYTATADMKQDIRRTYQVMHDDKIVPVCRVALAAILGVAVTRIRRAVKKKTPAGIMVPDMRGKHTSHPKVNPNLTEIYIFKICTYIINYNVLV